MPILPRGTNPLALAIAILILKSGIELAIETVRALRGEEVDFSRYELAFIEEYNQFQKQQLADWLLSVVAEQGPMDRAALLTRCREVFDVEDVPVLREMGWGATMAGSEKRVAGALELLAKQGLLHLHGEALEVTQKGIAALGAQA
ncbi:MAG: hypothetical protein PVF70_13545 [Anaerolineales bacterium]